MRIDLAMLSVVLALSSTAATAADTPPAAAEAALRHELAQVRRELAQAELDLEDAKKALRFGPDAAQAARAVRESANDARIADVAVEPIAANDHAASAVTLLRLDISGRAPYERIDNFLHRLTIAGSAVGFDDLRLDAASGRTTAFRIRLVYPVLELPPTPRLRSPHRPPAGAGTPREQAQAAREAVVRAMIDAEGARARTVRDAARALRATIARLRGADTVNALAAFAREMDERAVALTTVRVSDEATVTGFVLGGQAAKAIRPSLEKAGFDVSRIEREPQALCTSFTAVARLRQGERPLDVALRNGLFDDAAATACRARAPPTVRVEVKGSDPRGVTLRLRDADPATVLLALHDASGESFVVAGGLDQRFDVTASDATATDILERLRATGLAVSGGRLHRVPPGAFREQQWDGQPVNLALRDADLASVLCLFQEISALPIRIRADMRASVSAFLTNVPWDEALAGIVAAAGEGYAIDGNRAFVGTKGGDPAAVEVCGARSPTGARAWRRGPSRLDDLEAADLSLAGLAYAGGKWKAYAYAPMRRLWTIEPGATLADSRVQSVGSEGVRLETGAGRLVELRLRGD